MEQQVPGVAAEGVADGDLDEIERGVGDQAVEPHDAGPAPPDGGDGREGDGGVHGHEGSHQLRRDEGAEEQRAGPVEEGDSPAAGDEYQRLARDAHLQVHRRRDLLLRRVPLQRPHVEMRLHAELGSISDWIEENVLTNV